MNKIKGEENLPFVLELTEDHMINEADNSTAVEGAESELSPTLPGWPPAALPEHECESPHVGLPHPNAHGT
jgi:hypothetical protein